MTKKTREIRRKKIFHSTLSENSKKADRSLSLSSTLSTFDKLHRITRLKNVIDLSIAKRRNVMYSNLSKSKRTSSLLKRFQNQTIRDNNNVKLQLKTNLNYNFENFDEEEKKKSQTFSQFNMLNSLLIKRKRKNERFQFDKRVTINWTKNENNTYRCMLRNNTKILVKKFNFVSLKNFFQLMKSDSKKLFAIVKHILKTYQSMNNVCETFQKNLTMTISDMKKLKTRIETQKQKLIDLFKKHEQKSLQTNELKRILTFKKKKIAKFRKSRNAHRDNFDKINIKTKSLMLNKKTMQKTIEKLKKKLKFARSYLSLKNFDRKNEKQTLFKSNKSSNEINHVKLFRRKKSMFISQYEHHKQKNEMTITFLKHKYSKLSIFYENTKKWKSWKTHLIIKI